MNFVAIINISFFLLHPNENLEKNIKFFKELLFANSAESIVNNPQISHSTNSNRYKM